MFSLSVLALPLVMQVSPAQGNPPGAAPIARPRGATVGSNVPPQAGTGATATPADEKPAETPVPSGRVVRLDDAEKIALQHQPQMMQARANTDAARGRYGQARSGLLPQVVGTATAEEIHGSVSTSRGTTTGTTGTSGTTTTAAGTATGASATSTVAVTGTAGYFIFGGSASQLLWDFGTTYYRTDAANKAVESLEASEQTTELNIVLNVRKAYFGARAQKDLITVAAETVNNQIKHLKQTEGFVQVGTQPEIALAQAKTDLANYRVQLINAQNNYEISKAQLNQAMGLSESTNYDVASDEQAPVPGEDLPREKLIEQAMAQRPELLAYLRTRQSDRLAVRAAKGSYGPSISAVGGVNEAGVALDSLGLNWNVGATATWALFQGGYTQGQVREAQGNLDAADAALEAEKLQVRFDVDQAQLMVRADKIAIDAARDALINAREQLRLADGRYSAGVGSIIELGDAQVALQNAGAQLVTAQFNLSTARAQLLTALGKR
jgi:outer membrane protein